MSSRNYYSLFGNPKDFIQYNQSIVEKCGGSVPVASPRQLRRQLYTISTRKVQWSEVIRNSTFYLN